ncbi:hypothetical protein WDZ17_17250, partial [Pseudokineococcus basanitobsidens]
SRTLDLLEHLRGRRGRRQPLVDPDDEEVEALTWAELEALTARVDAPPRDGDLEAPDAPGREDPWDAAGEPPAAHPPASRPEEAVDDEVLPAGSWDRDAPASGSSAAPEGSPGESSEESPEESTEESPEDTDEPEDAPRSRRRRRRAGAGRDDGGVPGQEELLPEPERPEAGADADGRTATGAVPDGAAGAAGAGPDDDAAATGDGDDTARRGARRSGGARRGARPGVPSWDDIVFGQRRD